jgi:uncharacterized SAM-binding protein YcdF (DUF218 family)
MLFYFKKIVTPFCLPPGIFIVLLFLLGLWFIRKKRFRMGLLQISIGILMWVAALGPLAYELFENLESEFPMPKNPTGDVIVLLGGGINDAAKDLSGIGIPSSSLLERIVAAVRLHKRIGAPVIASGGSAFDQKISEAAVIKRYLMALDVPENMIILENKSRDTHENAKYTKKICDKAGYTSPILVTTAYHLRRAVRSFEKAGLSVVAVPVGARTGGKKPFHFRNLLPNDYQAISFALQEYLGRVFYAIAY